MLALGIYHSHRHIEECACKEFNGLTMQCLANNLVFAGHLILLSSGVSRLAERLYLLASDMPSGPLPVSCAQAIAPV